MAQFYTLEEAAGRLSLGVEDLKRRLKTEWTSIRPFRDGATLRFRAADIDELARSLGAASDPVFNFAPPGASHLEESSDDFELSIEPEHTSSGSPATPKPGESPSRSGIIKSQQTKREAVTSDFFAPTPGESGVGKVKGKSGIVQASQTQRQAHRDDISFPQSGSESGVGKSKMPNRGVDSDVRLQHTPAPIIDIEPESGLQVDDVNVDLSGPTSAVIKPSSSIKMSAPKSGTKLTGSEQPPAKIPSATSRIDRDSSSEFELSLDSDSDSFELDLNADSSDEEIDLGGEGFPKEKPDQQSGIDLGKPADSGIDLGKASSGIELGKASSGLLGPKPGQSSSTYSQAGGGKLQGRGTSSSGNLTGGRTLPPSASTSSANLGGSVSSGNLGSAAAFSAANLGPASKRPHSPEMDIDFELELDPDAAPATGRNSARPLRHQEPKSRVGGDIVHPGSDSDSEFELSLDEHSGITEQVAKALSNDQGSRARGGNIFETDFEIPVVADDQQVSGRHINPEGRIANDDLGFDQDMESQQVVVPEESGSQVMLVDDTLDAEGVQAFRGGMPGGAVDMNIVTDDITSSRGMLGPTVEKTVVRTIVQAPPKWGPIPALILLPTFFLVFLGGLMSFEVVRGMWGYHQSSKPGGLIVRGVADVLGMKLID